MNVDLDGPGYKSGAVAVLFGLSRTHIWAGMPILLPTASKQLNLEIGTLFIAYDGINRSWTPLIAHRHAVHRSVHIFEQLVHTAKSLTAKQQ